jgi:hypothetical protein
MISWTAAHDISKISHIHSASIHLEIVEESTFALFNCNRALIVKHTKSVLPILSPSHHYKHNCSSLTPIKYTNPLPFAPSKPHHHLSYYTHPSHHLPLLLPYYALHLLLLHRLLIHLQNTTRKRRKRLQPLGPRISSWRIHNRPEMRRVIARPQMRRRRNRQTRRLAFLATNAACRRYEDGGWTHA